MIIEICYADLGQACTVQLGKWQVPFGDEAQAIAFVNRLQQRINAPHRLPQSSAPWQLAEWVSDNTAIKQTAVGA